MFTGVLSGTVVIIYNMLSILRRMQSAGAGAEGDVHAFGIFRVRLRAIPEARATVDAFLAEFGMQENHVIRVAVRCLHLAAHEQRVLNRHMIWRTSSEGSVVSGVDAVGVGDNFSSAMAFIFFS